MYLSFLLFFIFFISTCSLINSQQLYIRTASTGCSSNNTNRSPTSVSGYSCNGQSINCLSYLTFFSQPPYNTVSSISTLLAADPSQLARLNSVSLNATFETAKTVLVPVNCSCSGPFYQVNSTYVIQQNDLFLTVANDVFQGLTSCVAIESQNTNVSADDDDTRIINVPLRCACPTNNQTDIGVRYLLSYVVNQGDSVSAISSMFEVDTGRTLQANGLSEHDYTIYPNTTLLIPLQYQPNISQINQALPPPKSQGRSSKVWIYVMVGDFGGLALIIITCMLVDFYCISNQPAPNENSDIWRSLS